MNRVDIIQRIIDKTGAVTYLEIGVNKGRAFLKIRAREKFGVDPNLAIPGIKKTQWLMRNPSNLRARYFEKTSDDFFESFEPGISFDVVFIDGLHTYEQAMKDVMHSLQQLSARGIIILHDCNPSNKAAACPAESIEHAKAMNPDSWNDQWNGDVWKAICHLRCTRNDLNVFVLNCDHGVGIVSKGRPETLLDITETQLSGMTYDDLASNRTELLNLKAEAYLDQFLNSNRN